MIWPAAGPSRPARRSRPDSSTNYEARHGRGFSTFTAKPRALTLELTQLVDPDDPVKLSRLTIATVPSQIDRLHHRAVEIERVRLRDVEVAHQHAVGDRAGPDAGRNDVPDPPSGQPHACSAAVPSTSPAWRRRNGHDEIADREVADPSFARRRRAIRVRGENEWPPPARSLPANAPDVKNAASMREPGAPPGSNSWQAEAIIVNEGLR